MGSLLSNEGAQLRSNLDKLCEELYELVDRRECNIEFDHGKFMAVSDCEMMKVSYAESANKAFWKPYVRDAKLDEALEDHDEMIDEIEQSIERGPTQTVQDAYLVSLQDSDFLWFCVRRSTVHNPVFDDGPEGLMELMEARKINLTQGSQGHVYSTVAPRIYQEDRGAERSKSTPD